MPSFSLHIEAFFWQRPRAPDVVAPAPPAATWGCKGAASGKAHRNPRLDIPEIAGIYG
jgi:hypothetical protein